MNCMWCPIEMCCRKVKKQDDNRNEKIPDYPFITSKKDPECKIISKTITQMFTQNV